MKIVRVEPVFEFNNNPGNPVFVDDVYDIVIERRSGFLWWKNLKYVRERVIKSRDYPYGWHYASTGNQIYSEDRCRVFSGLIAAFQEHLSEGKCVTLREETMSEINAPRSKRVQQELEKLTEVEGLF